MNTGSQKRLLVDAALFIGFIVCFFLELTGVSLHQWLGLAVGIVAAYHLITHRNWVSAVTRRFFASTSDQARIYYLLDAALLVGFLTIFGTGLVISTWLGLALSNYEAWFTLHAIASVMTLIVLVAKIWLHARWIVSTFNKRSPAPRPGIAPAGASANLPAQNLMPRRDFIKLMGAVGTASVFAAGTTLRGLGEFASSTRADSAGDSQSASASTPNTLSANTSTNSSTTSANSSSACVVRCNRRCAYPGHCRRYTDSNSSGRCDFGECLS